MPELPTPEAANKWSDTLKRMNDLNIVPLIACALMAAFLYYSRAEAKTELAAAEARSLKLAIECKLEAGKQAITTRETVRTEARAQGHTTRELVRKLPGVAEEAPAAAPP